MAVYIRGFVSNQSQYAYGDFKAPRMHTGTVIIPVCIRGLIPLESPYAYCDCTNPGMRTGIHLGPHMHTGIDSTRIPVRILRLDFTSLLVTNHVMHTVIHLSPRMHTGIPVRIRGLIPLESPYAYCDWPNPGMRTVIPVCIRGPR
jgi:hypothetical protein